jgi:hypothetical protein
MLSLKGCEKLKVLPSDLGNLSRLEHLNLSGCTGLQGFPDSLARLSKSCEEFFMPPRLEERMEAIRLACTLLPMLQPKAPAGHRPTVAQEVAQWCLQAAKDPVPETRYNSTTPPTPWPPGELVWSAAKAIIKAAEPGSDGLVIQVLPATSLPSAIGRLTQLPILWIERTACTALPDSICELAQLRSLSVLQTPLKSLPENIGKLSSLAKLQLSGSDWEQLPLGLTELTALSKLVISEQPNLKVVRAELGHLAKLQELEIRNCPELRSLPLLGGLSALERLDLSNCTNLKTLPSDLGDLRNLQTLSLTGCTNLETLPSNLGDLGNLKRLSLSGCTNLETLPSNLGELGNFERLDLSDCSKLKQLPESLSRLSRACTIWAPEHLKNQLADIRSRRRGSPATAAKGEKRA